MTSVRIWWTTLDGARPGLLWLLSHDEEMRHRSYRRVADADRFLLGVALTRLVISREVGVPPAQVLLDRRCSGCGKPHGKVRVLGNGGLELSITHSGDLVGIALSHGAPVGLDVEHLIDRLYQAELASHALSLPETKALGTIPVAEQPAAFLRYWVRKEAVVKATGDGIGVGLDNLTMSSPDDAAALLASRRYPDLPSRLALFDLSPAPQHLAALAVITDDPAGVTISTPPVPRMLDGQTL